jgi:hypothetical protein
MQDAHDTAVHRKAEDLALLLRWAAATSHVPDVGPKCGIGGSLEASATGELPRGRAMCRVCIGRGADAWRLRRASPAAACPASVRVHHWNILRRRTSASEPHILALSLSKHTHTHTHVLLSANIYICGEQLPL